MKALTSFLASMSGRIFMILLVGVALSAGVAWSVADGKRQADLARVDLVRAADRVQAVVVRWDAGTPEQQAEFVRRGIAGVRMAGDHIVTTSVDEVLTRLLAEQLPDREVSVAHANPDTCRDPAVRTDEGGSRARDRIRFEAPRQCWIATISGPTPLRLAVETPPRPRGDPLVFEPIFLTVLALAAAILALLVARMAAAPLATLSTAATNLGADLQRLPMPIRGPTEVRSAAEAFNAMQERLQQQMAERMHMLAAITHDLQTPVTRLRLRLERVEDAALRERLLADLGAMQTLIREGLDLARSADRNEAPSRIDLRSLLESIVDDAADAGQDVTLTSCVDTEVQARPDSLRRVVLNLVENALKYGVSARVSAALEAGAPVIRIRDQGPGLPDGELEAVFSPFVRLEDSRSRETGGSGLGLTIARTLAERDGATVSLRNHPGGGAEAIVRFAAQA